MNGEIIHIGDKAYKKCRKHLLKVLNPNFPCLVIGTPELGLRLTNSKFGLPSAEYYHLYITDDSVIKEGDSFYCTITKVIGKAANEIHAQLLNTSGGRFKVIATTDTSLILENHGTEKNQAWGRTLPRPSNDFLAAYVKAQGKGFEEILVELNPYFGSMISKYPNEYIGVNGAVGYKIKVAPDNTITCKAISEIEDKSIEKASFKFYPALENLSGYTKNYSQLDLEKQISKRIGFIEGAKSDAARKLHVKGMMTLNQLEGYMKEYCSSKPGYDPDEIHEFLKTIN